jgi:tetratricopeptide (TPR) repeat protein
MSNSIELIRQGKELLRTLHLQEAKQRFAEALAIDPNSLDAKTELARLALIQGAPHVCIAIADDVLSSQANSGDTLAIRGAALMLLKKWDEARETLERACKLDPNLATTHLNLARCLRELKNYPEAETAINKAMELTPEDFQVRTERSYIYAQTGRIKEGIEDLLSAIRINPYFLSGYTILGSLYKTADSPDIAIAIFKKGLLHLPNALVLHEELCELYAEKNDFISACRHASEIVRKRNQATDFLRLSLYAFAAKRNDIAEKAISKALSLTPQREAVRNELRAIKLPQSRAELYEEAEKLLATI